MIATILHSSIIFPEILLQILVYFFVRSSVK